MNMQKGGKENVLVICAVALCFALTLGLCFAFSGEGILGVFGSAVDGESVYAVAVGGYDDITLARTTSELIKSRGGAGYVRKDGENYEIIYAVYPDSATADRVRAAVGDGSAYVSEIRIPNSKLKWAGELKDAASDALTYYKTAFDALYECGNDLNTMNADITDVNTRIKVLYGKIEDIKSRFYEKTNSSDLAEVTEIKVALITVLALIDNIEFDGDRAACAASIRYALTQLALSRSALMERI